MTVAETVKMFWFKDTEDDLLSIYKNGIKLTYTDEQTSDIIFLVSSKDDNAIDDTHKFLGIQAVFAAQSSVLATQISQAKTKHDSNDKPVILNVDKIICPETFHYFVITFLIGLEIDTHDDLLANMLYIANKYKINNLSDAIIDYIVLNKLADMHLNFFIDFLLKLTEFQHNIEIRALIYHPRFCLSNNQKFQLLACDSLSKLKVDTLKHLLFDNEFIFQDFDYKQRYLWEACRLWCEQNTADGENEWIDVFKEYFLKYFHFEKMNSFFFKYKISNFKLPGLISSEQQVSILRSFISINKVSIEEKCIYENWVCLHRNQNKFIYNVSISNVSDIY